MEIRIGQRFDRWEVIGEEIITNGRHSYLCRCSCPKGTERHVDKFNLLSGKSKSCGCITGETTRKRMRTHGKTNTRLFNVWINMKGRCHNKNNASYKNYGGRGITVCNEWKDDYLAFERWALENGYDESASYGECTIDRIDVNKSYSPDNCRWLTLSKQANNRTTTIWLTYNGKTQTIIDWAKELGISEKLIRRRRRSGMSVEEMLKPNRIMRNTQILSFNGEEHSIAEWARITGISVSTLYSRHRNGWSVERMLTTK